MNDNIKTTYAKADADGVRHETNASIKRRVSKVFGFKTKSVVLLEASFRSFQLDGIRYCYCTSVDYAVNGLGYSTDFESLTMNEAFNI